MSRATSPQPTSTADPAATNTERRLCGAAVP
jgi:hypothetical protein